LDVINVLLQRFVFGTPTNNKRCVPSSSIILGNRNCDGPRRGVCDGRDDGRGDRDGRGDEEFGFGFAALLILRRSLIEEGEELTAPALLALALLLLL